MPTDLGRDAVLVLVGQSALGIPATAVQILELGTPRADILRLDARGGDQAERHRRLQPLDDEGVADAILADHARRTLAKRRVDIVDVAVRRLGDVRIGRNRAPVHASSSVSGRNGRLRLDIAARRRRCAVSSGGSG